MLPGLALSAHRDRRRLGNTANRGAGNDRIGRLAGIVAALPLALLLRHGCARDGAYSGALPEALTPATAVVTSRPGGRPTDRGQAVRPVASAPSPTQFVGARPDSTEWLEMQRACYGPSALLMQRPLPLCPDLASEAAGAYSGPTVNGVLLIRLDAIDDRSAL